MKWGRRRSIQATWNLCVNCVQLVSDRAVRKGELRGMQLGGISEQVVTRLLCEKKELREANYIVEKALGFMAD